MTEATADGDANANPPIPSCVTGKPKKYDIWYHVLRDDRIFQDLLGQWNVTDFILLHESEWSNNITANEANSIEVESFRSLASPLPFAVKFILELHIFNNNIIEIQQAVPPEDKTEGELVALKEKIAKSARRMVLTFIQHVIPTLLEIEWNVDVDAITLNELFAREIECGLIEVKKGVAGEQHDVKFDDSVIREAMMAAQDKLTIVNQYVGAAETDLASLHSEIGIDIIRKRAKWPYTEYSCRFVFGHLVATELEIINEPGEEGERKSESRRGLREGGWMIRDRFCRVTNAFHSSDDLVDRIAAKPNLCGRSYELLFDKGVSTSMKIWLMSNLIMGMSRAYPDLEVTRDSFLCGLGCFANVNMSKLGDRIGLAFSQTKPILRLSKDNIILIDEISENGYAFSDGCGVMGLNIALKIKEQWGCKYVPGAAQIRIGGIKGMLSLNTKFDTNSIGIRPSMIKFPSNHLVLEVKRVAGGFSTNNVGPDAIYTDKIFNQALLVLPHLGLPYRVFWDLQMRACARFALEHDQHENPLDLLDDKNYVENVFSNGKKSTGESFSTKELDAIKESMIACREKVNLPAQVRVMLGILDESNLLEEGEVLVGNGAITGDVLVLRSPCMFPGDIQKVRAISKIEASPFVFLENTLVFSSKGERPLQDMLGGGDLDGDEYFVIYEPSIVDAVTPTHSHDYGTKHCGNPKTPPIFPPDGHCLYAPPNLSAQLAELKQFIRKGNVVADTAEAWLRAAAINGVAHELSLGQAELHQRSLDARKLESLIDLSSTQNILETVPRLHFRNGRRDGKHPCSSLGIIYELWVNKIKKIDILIKKRKKLLSSDLRVLEKEALQIDIDTQSAFDDMSRTDKDNKHEVIEGQLHRYCIVCNNPRGKKRCVICNDAWVCLGQCEIKHWRMCFGIQWQSEETDNESHYSRDGSIVVSSDFTSDTASLTSFDEYLSSVSYGVSDLSIQDDSQEDILESLVRIVFGKDSPPRIDSVGNINWAHIDKDAILALRKCVLLEFYEGFQRDLHAARQRVNQLFDSPHIHDVFTMSPSLAIDNITIAVLLRNHEAGGALMWRDKHDCRPRHPRDPPHHKYRVANLSGPSRVLEALCFPSPGSLMDLALRRDSNSFVKAVEMNDLHIEAIPSTVAAILNPCQKRAVATVLSPTFNNGFFLVQGPPGTGKTVTLAAMMASLKHGGLVLASSNAAVANIAVKLLSVSKLSVRDIIVYGDNCNETVEFLSPVHRSRRYRRFKKHFAASQSNNHTEEELIREFLAWLRLDPTSTNQNEMLNEIERHCPMIDAETSRGQHALTKLIKGAKAILCTLNTAGSVFLRKTVGDNFDTLFLDEAAQCTEAEFYIAANFPGISRMVLIGDPKQLNATVLHPDLKELGFGNSFMTNVMDCQKDAAHLLGIQYRCHPAIMRFSNHCFYDNALLTSRLAADRKPKVCNPLLFINTGFGGHIETRNTVNQGREEKYFGSWRNPFEAQAVKRILLKDPDILTVREQVKPSTTIIITPYRAQVALITKVLGREKSLTNVKIDTVDSFQGQEADIVVFSAVRTESEGFVNDAQRINVALTRAKRVLRIVGDMSFWSSTSKLSAMNKLVEYCHQSRLIRSDDKLGKRAAALLKPRFHVIDELTWIPAMTSRFHDCLFKMSQRDKNIAMNTLLTLCMPQEDLLANQVNTKVPCWQQSALDSFEWVQIVWVAKENSPKPKIEAHFAGKKEECNTFRQKNIFIPKDTLRIKHGLTGVSKDSFEKAGENEQSRNIDIAWTLNECLGTAIVDGELDELPEGYFDLDPDQREIAFQKPPLLIESGSGTGKTNVLFQHAVNYAYQVQNHQEERSICFITVSPRLVRELKKRYDDVIAIERMSLPDLRFFSLRELLDGLLKMIGSSMNMKSACTFRQHVNSRGAHSEVLVDTSEAENEISGVILGSLESAKKVGSLTREEYIDSKRSNIDASSQDGMIKRHLVYDEFVKYNKWKLEKSYLDKDDVVLQLIRNMNMLLSKRNPLFDAVYLDEIQDFTYASIFLICSIAGKPELRWICAGDTAQMISPGCSFKFEGLKQTMLAVQPSKIKKVVKLAKNYRVTKDVLDVANSILKEAKKCFKGSIEYARPEVAVKDLGTKVLWCDWDEAMRETPKFGTDQALILTSTNNEDALLENMNKWLDSHPFLLPVLESKGLEFLDVVVAFDVDRRSWTIKEDQTSSLRLLRELYVAITRAKRRVVILIKRDVATMRDFFESLEGVNIMKSDAKTAFLEFDSITSSEEWFQRGRKLFEDEEYKTAAGCFKAANRFPYFHWAQGKFEISMGLIPDGKESFRKAARAFFEEGEHSSTLELLALVMDMGWNPDDDYIYEKSKEKCPSFFTAEKSIRFALERNKWSEITVENLKSKSTAQLFLPYRGNDHLMEKLALCSEVDREDIECSLPLFVGDYYLEENEFLKAIELYLGASEPDIKGAENATNAITQLENSSKRSEMLKEVAAIWMTAKAEGLKVSSSINTDNNALMLLHLFEFPVATARSSRPATVYKTFGKDVVKHAFIMKNASMELLHHFNPDAFEVEIREALNVKYKDKLIDAVRWYHSKNQNHHASALAMERITEFNDKQMLSVISMDLPLKGIPDEAARRGIRFQTQLIEFCLKQAEKVDSSSAAKVDLAVLVTDKALASMELAGANASSLVSVWISYENNPSIKMKLGSKKRRNKPHGRGISFLNLLFQPNECTEQMRRNIMQWFGKRVVELVVSQNISNKSERYAILSKFDSKEFQHLRPQPKPTHKQGDNQKPTSKTTTGTTSTIKPIASKTQPTNGFGFKKGDAVVIKGLKSRPELNGKRGNIILYDGRKNRFGVKVADQESQLSIKPENLERFVQLATDYNSSDSRASLHSRNRSASSSSSDDSDNLSSGSSWLDSSSNRSPPFSGYGNKSSDDEMADSSDGSMPTLVHRNDSSDSDDDVPPLAHRNDSSSDDDVPPLAHRNDSSSDDSM